MKTGNGLCGLTMANQAGAQAAVAALNGDVQGVMLEETWPPKTPWSIHTMQRIMAGME